MPLNFFSATIAANSASKKLTAFDKRTQACCVTASVSSELAIDLLGNLAGYVWFQPPLEVHPSMPTFHTSNLRIPFSRAGQLIPSGLWCQ